MSSRVVRAPTSTSLIEVLDRVLDKGMAIDSWERMSLLGLDLSTVHGKFVVSSIDTHMRYADALLESNGGVLNLGLPDADWAES